MTRRISLLLLLLALSLGAQTALDNEAVTKLLKAGLGEDIIVNMINSQAGKYATSADDIIALKKSGAGDKIIAAIVTKAAGGGAASPAAASNAPAPAASTAPAGMPTELGIYFKKNGVWTEVLPEVVNWKTGGTIKSLASAGVVKKDVNGNIVGTSSRNSIKSPLEFLMIAPEGVAITEYQLIRLRINKDYREFRTVTGGVFNQRSGAMRDMVPFEGKKVAPRMFNVVLPENLGAGQYGFLPPGAVGSTGNTMAQIGKMYTFHLVE
ncbi:MAG: hypothetical protein IT162_01540 [Bryobacterales bacterium]|nr:hypothetical protein [Bryobacterales bacterium]